MGDAKDLKPDAADTPTGDGGAKSKSPDSGGPREAKAGNAPREKDAAKRAAQTTERKARWQAEDDRLARSRGAAGAADRPRTEQAQKEAAERLAREKQRSARRGGKPKTSGSGARRRNGARGGSSTSGRSARRRLASFEKQSSIATTGKRWFRAPRPKSRSGHSWRRSSDGRAGRTSTDGHSVKVSSVVIAGVATTSTHWARRSDDWSRTHVRSPRDARPSSSAPRVRRRNDSSRIRRSGAPVSNPSVRVR